MAIDKRHIENIFGQRFSLRDHRILNEYFESDQLNEETKLVLKYQWEQFEIDPQMSVDLDNVFYKLYYTINQNSSASTKRKILLRFTQIAAVLIIGLFLATGIYFLNSYNQREISQSIEFKSQTGFRNQFKLPDGTTGWLGYGSDLRYYVDEKNQRIVDLDGLAYFNVYHDKNHPFIVKTPTKLAVRDLGTKFNVSAYLADHSCEVVVEQGRVSLSLQDKKIGQMVPNERVEYNAVNSSFKKSKVDVADYLAWKDGRLIIKNIPLKEACAKLSRFYNVNFELQAKGLNDQKVRLVLENEKLEDALSLLKMIVPVKYEVKDREIQDDNSYSKRIIVIKNR